jgi:hypothetical protein
MLRIIFRSLGDIWEDLFITLTCNLAWLIAQVLVVPGPPATLALFFLSNQMVQGEAVDFGDFWRAIRRYWGLGWRWGAVNLLVVLVLLGDYGVTGRFGPSSWAPLLQGFYLAVLGGWLLVQWFALAFLFEQEQLSLRTAWRNAAALIGRHPLWVLGLTLLTAAILVLATALFLLSGAVGGLFSALVTSRAVHERLGAYRESISQ